MSTVAAPTMTVDEFLALPQDDGVSRLLIHGELREYPMPERNYHHGRTANIVSYELEKWLRTQPEPRGAMFAGDVGVRLSDDVSFGGDLLYVSAEVMACQSRKPGAVLVGVPELAVEIMSPGEVWERHQDKREAYLEAGVKVVWVLDPRTRAVTIYRHGVGPKMVSDRDELTAPDVLPGFRVPAADLFG